MAQGLSSTVPCTMPLTAEALLLGVFNSIDVSNLVAYLELVACSYMHLSMHASVFASAALYITACVTTCTPGVQGFTI
jgi:hypothetical protein